MVVTLDDLTVRQAAHAVNELIRRRRLAGARTQLWLAGLADKLTTATADGNPKSVATQHSKQPIDTAQAALILGVTPRRIRQLAADLDGQHIAGRWVFNRDTVTDYANHRNEHHHGEQPD